MPRTARAEDRIGHDRGGSTSRAAHRSSHSTSSESGRDRRRKGKLKMRLQLDAANAHISAIEHQLSEATTRLHSLESQLAVATSRNSALVELVNELTQRCARQDSGHSAEIFDLFGDEADPATYEAFAQTDISVDLNKPDVFLTLPLDHPAPSTSTADAAAGTAHAVGEPAAESYQAWSGNGMATPRCLHTTLDGLRDTITDSQYHAWSGKGMATTGCCKTHESRVTGQWQALDDVNPEHHCSSDIGHIEDFNSQNLAEQCGHSHDSPPTVLFDASSSKDLAVQYGPSPQSPSMHLGVKADTHGSQVSGQRQVLNSVVTEHRSSSGEACHVDFNSQNLANQCGPSPHCPPSVLLDAISKDIVEQCGPSHTSSPKVLFDALSQDPADQSGPLLHSPSTHHGGENARSIRALPEDLDTHGTRVPGLRQALDVVNAEHRSSSGKALHVDFNSQNLAKHGGPSPHSPPSVLFDAISKDLDLNGPLLQSPSMHLSVNSDTHDSQVSGQRQAHDSVVSEHLSSSGESDHADFNSQNLAKQCGPTPHCPPFLPLDASSKDHSQDCAEQSGPLLHSPSVHLGGESSHSTRAIPEDLDTHGTQVAGLRQALDGVNAEHRSSSDKAYLVDFNSQNLAKQCGPSLQSPPSVRFDAISKDLARTTSAPKEDYHSQESQATGQKQALDGDDSETCSSGNVCQGDFNSHNLAGHFGQRTQCGPLSQSKDPDCPAHLTQQEYVSSLAHLAESHPEFEEHFLAALRKARQFL